MNRIQPTEIVAEMKRAYLDYAMTVIVARALPDVRDGLKPVHRRILYAMWETGLRANSRFRKSAAVVGEVLKSYHPHGDGPVYEAMVRLAQDFVMRYPLVCGQGNFGSIDGDPPASMRYTEAKLTPIAEELMVDLDKNTVEMVDNFDSTLKEPICLPAKLPNLLLMGAEGIAVGMATKIPPHNLTEVVGAINMMIDKAKEIQDEVTGKKTLVFETNVDEIMEHIKGPDFPTGGIIYGYQEIRQAMATGRASLMVRAVVEEEELSRGRSAIVVTELPYQVNKANLVAKIAQLVVDKKIVGISDLRDESDRQGMRIVIELKRDATYKQVLNNLYKHTDLQSNFPVNLVALVDGVPQTLSVQMVLEHYIRHRVDVITRRTEFELEQAKKRAHILEGYLIALDNIDEIVEIIKKSVDEAAAKEKLMEKFDLSQAQSQAILDMQLKKLTGLERAKIEEELKKLRELITELEGILKDVFKLLQVIKKELAEMLKLYGDKRRTKIIPRRLEEISDEMLIENKEVIVVFTREGYIKQVPKDTFKVQGRGGKGVSGMETKESDNVAYITTAMLHDDVLFFSNKGRVFQTRVWDIPQGSRTSKGKAIVNMLDLRPQEQITAMLTLEKHQNKGYIVMTTRKGTIKKTSLADFQNIRTNGITAIKLEDGDELDWVKLSNGKMYVMIVSSKGQAIVFKEEQVRPMGRATMGVRGINLDDDDMVAAMEVFSEADFKKDILVLGERGIGKRTRLSEFKDQKRGGKGVRVASVDKKMGRVAFVAIINEQDVEVIITTTSGQVVKIALSDIPVYSRVAKGVYLMRLNDESDKVATAAIL